MRSSFPPAVIPEPFVQWNTAITAMRSGILIYRHPIRPSRHGDTTRIATWSQTIRDVDWNPGSYRDAATARVFFSETSPLQVFTCLKKTLPRIRLLHF